MEVYITGPTRQTWSKIYDLAWIILSNSADIVIYSEVQDVHKSSRNCII